MPQPVDLRPLLGLAFHETDVTDATRAIEEARTRFAAQAKMDGFSYEVVVPAQPDREWLVERVLRPFVYFCESRGAPLPACPGVFVSLFAGTRLYCILGAELLAWAGRELGVAAEELHARYGLGERETTVR